jgi:hypothetical protein
MDSSIDRSNCHKAPQATPCGRRKKSRTFDFWVKTCRKKIYHSPVWSANALIHINFSDMDCRPIPEHACRFGACPLRGGGPPSVLQELVTTGQVPCQLRNSLARAPTFAPAGFGGNWSTHADRQDQKSNRRSISSSAAMPSGSQQSGLLGFSPHPGATSSCAVLAPRI